MINRQIKKNFSGNMLYLETDENDLFVFVQGCLLSPDMYEIVDLDTSGFYPDLSLRFTELQDNVTVQIITKGVE